MVFLRALGALFVWRKMKRFWTARRERPTPPGRTRIGDREMVDATVDELVATVKGLLKDETDRAASLNTRGSGLTGFIGIILSVAAAAGAATGGAGPELDRWARVSVGISVAVALAFLVAALILVIAKVLLPTEGWTIAMAQVQQYPHWNFISLEPPIVQGGILRNLVRSLQTERDRNAGKAKWLGWSYKLVAVGLVLVALAGATATLDRYVGGTGGADRCPRPGLGDQRSIPEDHSGRKPVRRPGDGTDC
jgi:hypothetical protein